jgi:excisionase family DNA binding protein
MRRRLQFGMRENPASDRRHGSRLAASIRATDNYVQEENLSPPPSLKNDHPPNSAVGVPQAAQYQEATGREKNRAERSRIAPPHTSSGDGDRSFEPLIASSQAAKLLGNIHIKTLQRYARLGSVPGYQIGGHWYFRASDLDDWLQTQINSKSPTR